jgi:oxalate decarboxylase
VGDKAGADRRHAYNLEDGGAGVQRDGGQRLDVTADQLPLLDGIALSMLSMEPGAAREPHWHPNAAELTYCAEGSARITIVEPGGTPVVFAVEQGDLFFVPPGFLHGIESTADGEARFLVCFSHERPEDLNLSASFTNMGSGVLDASFRVDGGTFDWVAPATEPAFVVKPESPASSPEPGESHYRYQLERLEPDVENDGGSLRFARGDDFPILDGLAMYSLRFNRLGVREPHWHPNCAELNYVVTGRVKMTVVSPDDDVDTFELSAGEVSYIPTAYFHHIESLVEEEVEMCVFFNHEMPGDNGIAASVSGFSSELLAKVFGRPAATFESLPRFDQDVLISSPAANPK